MKFRIHHLAILGAALALPAAGQPGLNNNREEFNIRVPGPPPGDRMFFGPEKTIQFISSEMNFEGKLVKNAPYSGEAVTETVQRLADGNRIAHKNTAVLYRDSEGRTRR